MQSEYSSGHPANEKIRVLLAEGVESQAKWLRDQLKEKGDYFELDWKQSYQSALDACMSGEYHVGLVGSHLDSEEEEGREGGEGVEFIQELRRNDCDMPLLYCATHEDLSRSEQSKQVMASLDVLTTDQISVNGLDQCLMDWLKSGLLEQQFREEKEKLSATLNCVKNGVILVREHGAIDYLNMAAENMLGVTMAEVVGQPLLKHLHLIDEVYKVNLMDDIVDRLTMDEPFRFGPDVILVSRTGEEFTVECTFTPVYLRGTGKSDGFVIAVNDITEVRKYNEQLHYEATHDNLTGLSNRAEFENAVQQAIENAHEHQRNHCVLYLDIDQFKVINDTCGHLAGDELLIQLSEHLKQNVRRRDTLSRLGGDKFGIVLWRCGPDDGCDIVAEIMEDVSQFRFQWNDKNFAVTFSVGMVVIDETCMTWAEVLSRADSACYVAKENGRNRLHISDASDPQTVKRFGEMEWVSELIQGLEEQGFQFFRQEIRPIEQADAKPNYEILLRYADRTGRIHLPEHFLPAAERYNIITMVDRWVVAHVLEWVSDNPGWLDGMEKLSINLSGVTIQDDASLSVFQDILRNTKVDLTKICFEITETVPVSFMQRANYFIKAVKEFGCSFALDDFGSGMSSFAYLKHLPVDYIKIDGGFSTCLVKDPVDVALVKSINEVAHIMGKKTIATRCEDEATFNKYREIGVDFVQGYYVGHPSALNDGDQ